MTLNLPSLATSLAFHLKTIQSTETSSNWQSIAQSLSNLRQLCENLTSQEDVKTLTYHVRFALTSIKKCIISSRVQISDVAIQLSKQLFNKLCSSDEISIGELINTIIPSIIIILGRANIQSRKLALNCLIHIIKLSQHSSIIPHICSCVTSKNMLVRPAGVTLLKNMVSLLSASVLRERMHMLEVTFQKALLDPQPSVQTEARATIVDYARKIPERCDGTLGSFPSSLRNVLESTKNKRDASFLSSKDSVQAAKRSDNKIGKSVQLPTRGVIIKQRLPDYSNIKSKIKPLFTQESSKSSSSKSSPKKSAKSTALKDEQVLQTHTLATINDTILQTKVLEKDFDKSVQLISNSPFQPNSSNYSSTLKSVGSKESQSCFTLSTVDLSPLETTSEQRITDKSSKTPDAYVNPVSTQEISLWVPKMGFENLKASPSLNSNLEKKLSRTQFFTSPLPPELETFASILSLKSPHRTSDNLKLNTRCFSTFESLLNYKTPETSHNFVSNDSKLSQDESFHLLKQKQQVTSLSQLKEHILTPPSLPRLTQRLSQLSELKTPEFDDTFPSKKLKLDFSFSSSSTRHCDLSSYNTDPLMLKPEISESLKRSIEESSIVLPHASTKRHNSDSSSHEKQKSSFGLLKTEHDCLSYSSTDNKAISLFDDSFPLWDSEVEDFMALSASELMSFSSLDSDCET